MNRFGDGKNFYLAVDFDKTIPSISIVTEKFLYSSSVNARVEITTLTTMFRYEIISTGVLMMNTRKIVRSDVISLRTRAKINI